MKNVRILMLVMFIAGTLPYGLAFSAPAKGTCSAKATYDSHGNYTGCDTNVNGHKAHYDPQELTALGCNTFCSSVNKEDLTKSKRQSE